MMIMRSKQANYSRSRIGREKDVIAERKVATAADELKW